MRPEGEPDPTAPESAPPGGAFERQEEQAAAQEASAIGGAAGHPDLPPSQRPLAEAGEGESEGFELAESDLVEHVTHGDQHAARTVIGDADQRREEQPDGQDGEPDHVASSERDQD